MEQDSNLIFVLRPINDAARKASEDSHNKEYYVCREPSKVTVAASRDSTPATNIGDEEEDVDLQDPPAKRPRLDEKNIGDREDLDAQLRFMFDRKLKIRTKVSSLAATQRPATFCWGRPMMV